MAQKTTKKTDSPQPEQGTGEKTGEASGDEPEATVDLDAEREQAKAEERQRIAEIDEMFDAVGVQDADLRSELIDDGVDADTAGRKIIAHLGKSGATQKQGRNAAPPLQVGTTAGDKFVKAGTNALAARVGHEELESGNPYASYSLMDLVRVSAERHGVSQRGKSKSEIIKEVFNTVGHTTSDFEQILSNNVGIAVLRGWEENNETWQEWTRQGSLPDFKEVPRVGLNLAPPLEELEEDGDIKFGTIGERGEPVILSTYARGLKISRKAIINDQLELLSAVPMALGRSAARRIGTLVYGLLTGNPEMSDGNKLFHANHDNTGSGELKLDDLGEAWSRMKKQQDPDEHADGGLNIEPKYLIVPTSKELKAEEFRTSDVDPNDTDRNNTLQGRFEVVSDSRLDYDDPDRMYFAADEQMHDTIEVNFLDGVSEPSIESWIDRRDKGVNHTVMLDAGAGVLDWRTFQRLSGSS